MVLHIKLHLITDFARSYYPELTQEAFAQFFFGINTKKLLPATVESFFPLFNEWLMFEYRLPNGRTMALEYFATNSAIIDPIALNELEQIIKTQFFDLFQITDWLPGKWIKARGIYSATDYTIEDVSLSQNLKSPGCLHTRIAQVNGTWITVGSNPLFIPMEYTPRAQKIMAKNHPLISVKDIISLYLPQKQPPPPTNFPSKRKSLPVKFHQLEIKYHLKPTFSELSEFIYNENYQSNFADLFTDLNNKLKIPQKVIVTHLQFFQDCWNFLPHRNLRGMAPVEKIHNKG